MTRFGFDEASDETLAKVQTYPASDGWREDPRTGEIWRHVPTPWFRRTWVSTRGRDLGRGAGRRAVD